MNLVLHIGAPKTATSTLQSVFFPYHPGLYFLGKRVNVPGGVTSWRTPEITDFMLDLERKNSEFAPDAAQVDRLVQEIKAEAGALPVVISSEDLCLYTGIDSFKKIERLQKVFGEFGPVRIILSVRDQVSLLKSIYITEHRGEMMRIVGTQQSWYPTFDQYLDIHFRYVWGAVLESFRFYSMLQKYEKIFGSNNIFVYPFSEFQRDPVRILKSMSDFLGIEYNESILQKTAKTRENQHYSERAYAFVKIRPFFSPLRAVVPAVVKDHFYRWLERGASINFNPSDDAVRRVKDYYKSDNDALFRKYGIRL